jgi:O-6-methylguanine DNA methyltransferase
VLLGGETKVLGFDFAFLVEMKQEEPVLIATAFSTITKLTQGLPVGASKSGVAAILDALVSYQDGEFLALENIEKFQSGRPFTESVWRQISRINPGERLTYQDLAVRSGNPKAVRAVGTACGRNKLPLFVPCHRVVPSGGGIGNYAFGSEIKSALLQFEFDRNQIQRSTLH